MNRTVSVPMMIHNAPIMPRRSVSTPRNAYWKINENRTPDVLITAILVVSSTIKALFKKIRPTVEIRPEQHENRT